eukprot:TCONS_00018902-protein
MDELNSWFSNNLFKTDGQYCAISKIKCKYDAESSKTSTSNELFQEALERNLARRNIVYTIGRKRNRKRKYEKIITGVNLSNLKQSSSRKKALTTANANADYPEVLTAKADYPEVLTTNAVYPEVLTAKADNAEVLTAKADYPEVLTANADNAAVLTANADNAEVLNANADYPDVLTANADYLEVL